MEFFRQSVGDEYLVVKYYLSSKTTLRDAAWALAIGQSVGNPNVRNDWETDELFERHSCIIIGDEQQLANLKEGIVEITFRSLKSNKTHKREYTTHKSFMPNLKNQSASDKILCYDVEFEKVEDIDVSTIEKYVPLQRLS